MAVNEVLMSVKATMMLNDGVSPSGSIKTVSQSLGTLKATGWDAEKIMAINNAAARVLDKTVYFLQGVKTYALESD